ncbi:lantibiotic dehydratase [Amycolatopsis sp. NPDC051371]|uniref:lantibiotic dehydratase n=1 Tax=Amycolatopsis sp. NPDC051371 TaxID=3155800 RepID=UPI00343F2DAE
MTLYTAIDAAMLRIAAQPSNVDTQSWPDLTAGTVLHWRDWLSSVWSDTAFAQAVAASSPDLARRVRSVCGGHEQRPRRVRSAVESVLRYRLRASSRATPFGRFAGVTPAAYGATARVRIGQDHRLTTRVEATWLSGVITELEQCPGLAERLSVVLNNTAILRDDRLVIGLRQAPGPAEARIDPAEVSIRLTAAIELTAHTAQTPIQLADLADLLAATYPGTATPGITAMLRQLVEQRVLISSLRPPMTVTDPLAHVRTVLTDIHAEDIPASASTLAALREHVGPHDSGPVDLRMDAEVVLPKAVVTEAARAAGVLARLTPHPFGNPIWVDYHARFLERYGIGAAVPLLELVNPGIGLGFPAGYRDSLLERPAPRVTGRDAAVTRLVQLAALDRRVAVALDDAAIAELEAADVARAQFPPHTELAVRVHAPNRAALDAGEFELVVSGAFRAAGTTTGRFLDLLDTAERSRFIRAYAEVPTVNAAALRVQASCPPLYTDTENVARSPQILPDLLSIGEHRTEIDGVLTPSDLLVVGDAHRLYLWSRSRARPVEPEVFSAVEFTNFAHPLLRFVCELTTARTAVCRPFSWGSAGQLPFLPRLTYRRTVLSPARWTLTSKDLPDTAASWQEWTTGVRGWQERMMVPAAVYLGGNDQRVLLNLDEPAHLYLLRAQLDRHGRATVHEAPTAEDFGWIDGHAHEIVVPLATTRVRTWPAIAARTTPIIATTAEDDHLPGAGKWLFCKLYGHPDRHTALLTTHLRELLWTFGGPVQWWFMPYRDPDDHLRLRIRLTGPRGFGEVATRVGGWAAELRRNGLIATMQLDTYRPETGRFGHGPAMIAAEAVFAADSAAALAQRTHVSGPQFADVRALTAASLVDLAAGFTGDTTAGAAWLIEHIATDPITAPARAVFDQALHLANPYTDAVRGLPDGEHIMAAWERRRAALATYRDTLTTTSGAPAPDGVLASLLHLHCIRTSGIAPDLERTCHRLARTAALSQTTHPKSRS